MCWETFAVVRLDLGPLVQGQTAVAKLDLGPLVQGQTAVAKLKSAHISLIIGPRGLACENNP